MEPTFNIAVVVLVTLQLAQQVSLSNSFYDTKDLRGPLNNELTFHSRFNVLSSLKSKQSVKRESQVKSQVELNHLNVERESSSRGRSKRQIDNAEVDAEIFSNDPKMFSYGKSMPMTTADDEVGDHQHETPESDSWNEDVDTTIKNSLGGLEGKPREADETTNGEQDSDDSQSGIQASHTVHSQFQDISAADQELTPKMTGEDNLSGRSLQTPQSNSSEIHIVPTLHYEGLVSEESRLELDENRSTSTSSTADTEMHDDSITENGDNDTKDKEIASKEHSTAKSQISEEPESNLEPYTSSKEEYSYDASNSESEEQKNEMETDQIVKTHEEVHSSEATASDQSMLANDKDVGHHKIEPEEVLSKELDIDEDEDEVGKHLDNEDVDVFMDIPVDDSSSKTSGQLKLQEDSIDYSAEGSGDMESDSTGSHETSNINENAVINSTDNTPSAEISSATESINFNIDTDSDKTKEENENTTEGDEEIEPPIPDPTEIASEVDDSSETNVLSEIDEDEGIHEEEPIPDPTGNSSNKDDPSLTYDQKAIINPFNMDNASEITRNIGKALGILDSSEDTDEGEESEGSGDPFLFRNTELEKNSLENGAMFKIDPSVLNEDTQTEDYIDTTTNKGDTLNENEVIEEPIVIHHHDGLLNAPVIPTNKDDILLVTQDSANVHETEVSGEDITHLPVEDNATQIPPEHEHRVVDTSSSFENGSTMPLPAGINELGIHNGEKAATPDTLDETSSSSTGSFIVLGAIMATIVALLGYSVIKSYKQKHETSRRPPEDDIGTELKEIDTLLSASGKNGHGPPNRLNVESDRLLDPNGENDKNDVKPDVRYPIYQNGVHGEDGISNKPTNVLQIEDPNDLSEVKVNSHNPDSSNALIPQVANGLKSSPGNSEYNNKLGEPKSPSANDRGSWGYGTKPETAKIKMFIDHDSIPKTPIVIVKRGPATVEM